MQFDGVHGLSIMNEKKNRVGGVRTT